MSENSIGLKTPVLEGLLEQTLGQRYYAFSSSITLCYAGSGWDSNQSTRWRSARRGHHRYERRAA